MGKHEGEEELRTDWEAATGKAAKLRVLEAACLDAVKYAPLKYDKWERRMSEALASIFGLAAEQYDAAEVSSLARAGWKCAKAMVKDDEE